MSDFLQFGLGPILRSPSFLEVVMAALLLGALGSFVLSLLGRGGRGATRLPTWLGLGALLAAAADRSAAVVRIARRFGMLDGGSPEELRTLVSHLMNWSAAIAIGAVIAATGLVLGWIAEAVRERREPT